MSLCQGLRAGFELGSLFTYIGAGVSSSMKRYVLNVYPSFCSLYVLCKHHVAMGVYLALDQCVLNPRFYEYHFLGFLFLKVFESCLLKSELFYLILYQISLYETRLLNTIHVLEMFVQFCSYACTWYQSHVPVTVSLFGRQHTGDVTASGYNFVPECVWVQRYIDIKAVKSLSSVSMFAIDLVDTVLRLLWSSVIKWAFYSFPA